MSKAIKFIDNVYLDSDSVVFKKQKLTDILTFSLKEQIIGKWVNGKPLYRKTIEIGALPNATYKSIAHNIANISSVVRIYGYASNGTNFMPLPFINPAGIQYCINLYANKTTINVETAMDRSSYNVVYATIEYVKSTD